MSDDLGKAVGASVEMPLGGHDWIVAPLTFEDYGKCEVWARQKLSEIAYAALAALLPKQRRLVEDAACSAALAPSNGAVISMTNGSSAQMFLAYTSIRKHHQDISKKQFVEMLPNSDDVVAIFIKAVELGGGSIETAKEDDEESVSL